MDFTPRFDFIKTGPPSLPICQAKNISDLNHASISYHYGIQPVIQPCLLVKALDFVEDIPSV